MFTVTNVFNQHELYFGQTSDSILLCYFVKAVSSQVASDFCTICFVLWFWISYFTHCKIILPSLWIDPDAKVAALSSRTLMATNRYICEVCHKGFQRDQNLQLHRKGHNLPWKLMQRPTTQVKKGVYVCPKPNCVHHHPSRALGDLTGVKKHFCRKHGEKKWKCDKCSKCYAVQSDWKAHTKICGTREHRCDCGIIFSR